MLDLDRNLLAKCLNDLYKAGVSWAEMMRESGVHNVSRIAANEIATTLSSWKKLHDAYPKDIPAPQFVEGDDIYQNIKITTADNGSTIVGRNLKQNATVYPPGVQVLINTIMAMNNPEEVALDLVFKLRERDK